MPVKSHAITAPVRLRLTSAGVTVPFVKPPPGIDAPLGSSPMSAEVPVKSETSTRSIGCAELAELVT